MPVRNRVLIQGTLGESENEVWSTGIDYVGPAGEAIQDSPALNGWAQNVHDLFLIMGDYAALAGRLSTSGKVSQIRVQYFNAAGVLVNQGESDPNPLAGIGAPSMPFQTAVCFSKRTGIPGRSFRGRNYWPCLAQQLSPDGELSGTVASATQLVENWARLLLDIGDSTGDLVVFEPQVYSPTLDVLTPVSTVLCGSVPDTQRRRRDDLIEAYSSSAYPPA